MLHIYSVMLSVLSDARPVLQQIGRHDRSQTFEDKCGASASVALNIAEGRSLRGKSGALRYSTALGSARETLACLQVAQARGYVASVDDSILDRLDRVAATLVKLMRAG